LFFFPAKNLHSFISNNEEFNKQEIIVTKKTQENKNKTEFLNRALTGLIFQILNLFEFV